MKNHRDNREDHRLDTTSSASRDSSYTRLFCGECERNLNRLKFENRSSAADEKKDQGEQEGSEGGWLHMNEEDYEGLQTFLMDRRKSRRNDTFQSGLEG